MRFHELLQEKYFVKNSKNLAVVKQFNPFSAWTAFEVALVSDIAIQGNKEEAFDHQTIKGD